MNERSYQVYPNVCGKKPDDENRGALRVGMVEENADMQSRGLSGYMAAVTHEALGRVRFYILSTTSENALFPNVMLWIGPYEANSEEIVPMEQA